MMRPYVDVAFTDEVRAVQAHKGSRGQYRAHEGATPAPTALSAAEQAFIVARDSFYLATVSSSGWPYVQHRGGPVGFVTLLDDLTIGWTEARGNRQYIGAGNIDGDGRIAMIMVDYPARARLKLFGRAVYHPDPPQDLIDRLVRTDARQDGAVVVTVEAVAWNCPKFITPRFTADEVRCVVDERDVRIHRLESELSGLRARFAALACD